MYKSIRLLTLAVIGAALTFTACQKEKVDPAEIELGKSYYPLQLGKYIVYKTDSTIYDDFDKVTYTRTNFLRYTILDTFRDGQGRLSYYTTVDKRKNDTDPWVSQEVIYATPTSYGLDVVQGNLRFTKLAFPVENGIEWQGNSAISSGDADLLFYQGWNYKYENAGNPHVFNDLTFDNTVTVLEQDDQTNDPDTQPTAYAEKTYSKAVYAFGVGLVEKEFTRWVYQVDPNKPKDAYRKGVSVVMSVTDHN